MRHRDQVAAIEEQIRGPWGWNHVVMKTVNAEHLGVGHTKPLPVEDGGAHCAKERGVNGRKHLRKIGGNGAGGKAKQIDGGDLRQGVKGRKQGVDIAGRDSAADEVQLRNVPDSGDCAGDHAAE